MFTKEKLKGFKFSELLETYLNLREELRSVYMYHGTYAGERRTLDIKPDLDLLGEEMNRRISGD